MTYTLIYYTTGWNVGPTIELAAIPAAGSLVRLNETADDENDEGIYYVDNVMHSEGGTIYLFVRPYTGYGKVAPLTESDRVKSAVDALRKEVAEMLSESEIKSDRRIELVRNDIADTNTAISELASAVDNLTDNLMERLKTEEF